MKIKDDFIKTDMLDGTWAVIPVGEESTLRNCVIQLNETGAMVWDGIEDGKSPDEIADIFVREYDIDKKTATEAVNEMIASMKDANVFEDE